MAVPIVKIRGVSKSFGPKLVLNDVSLDINEGEIFGVIGTSGAGKTTLLESLVGFYPINKGEFSFKKENGTVFSYATLKQDPDIKKSIGFSAQEPSFYDKLTVKENLEYFATLYNLPDQAIAQRTKKILELVELTGEENTLAGELSGGMKKRLDIACSIINDPKILILDEPTADLDPVLRRHIWSLIKKINSLGKTIVISSHFLEEMDELCNRIGIIYDHTVAHVGTIDDLRQNYSYDKEVIISLASQNYKKIASLLGALPITKIIQKGNRMVIYTKETERVLKTLLTVVDREKERILDLQVQQPSLDEVFASIITKTGGA